jgi:hypothetical protein
MELDQFIETTLVSIKKGIGSANVKIAEMEGKTLGQDIAAQFIMERNQDKRESCVSFDVAVTATQENAKNGGGGIKIAVVNLGGNISSADTHEHVSRIKFSVYPWTHVT